MASTDFSYEAFAAELAAIENWWLKRALDPDHGGVYGEIADDNRVDADADKGVILETRALWFFSELAARKPDAPVAEAARRLYDYIVNTFIDAEHGGVVWNVGASGGWRSDRKQVYAQAFAIYAFSAYAKAFGDAGAKRRALDIAKLLEARAYDYDKGGYIEAFARDWTPIEDWRLSERDHNSPKTMNTHLHVFEAYTALHALVGDDFTRAILAKNIDLFTERFVRPRGGTSLSLFYSMDWEDECGDVSYGHDIETSWLLCEAAEALGDPGRLAEARASALKLAESVLNVAIDDKGGLIYEQVAGVPAPFAERHWWPQAEAMVGFMNAFDLSGDDKFRRAAVGIWAFIVEHQIDHDYGEWRWVSLDDAPASGPYKVGFWKGPYHNSRAMMEMMRRIGDGR